MILLKRLEGDDLKPLIFSALELRKNSLVRCVGKFALSLLNYLTNGEEISGAALTRTFLAKSQGRV
jgi:hypothetical protein